MLIAESDWTGEITSGPHLTKGRLLTVSNTSGIAMYLSFGGSVTYRRGEGGGARLKWNQQVVSECWWMMDSSQIRMLWSIDSGHGSKMFLTCTTAKVNLNTVSFWKETAFNRCRRDRKGCQECKQEMKELVEKSSLLQRFSVPIAHAGISFTACFHLIDPYQ